MRHRSYWWKRFPRTLRCRVVLSRMWYSSTRFSSTSSTKRPVSRPYIVNVSSSKCSSEMSKSACRIYFNQQLFQTLKSLHHICSLNVVDFISLKSQLIHFVVQGRKFLYLLKIWQPRGQTRKTWIVRYRLYIFQVILQTLLAYLHMLYKLVFVIAETREAKSGDIG